MEKSHPTQGNNTNTEKLEKELAGLEREQKEKKGSDVELIKIEIEKIRKEIEQKKESSKEQGEKGVERVEKSGGEPEYIADAKKEAEVLNTKTEEATEPVEMSATDLFEQAQAMEAGQEAKSEEGVEKKDKIEQTAGVATSKKQEKTQSKWEKMKGILADEQIRTQAAKTTSGTLASITGVKSLYDVPAYLYQRFKVGGIFGSGKGLTGSVEKLVTKSEEGTSFGERYALWGEVSKLEKDTTLSADKKEEKLAELKRKLEETEPRKVRDAFEDLNTRLALTKEGEQKHSDQRKLIAKVLWERRTKEKMSMDEVRAKMDGILDDYTTTKVSGMQAVRESLNTALVVSVALTLRGVSYGALDAVERKQRLDKEAKNQGLSLEEKYQRLGDKNAKSVGKKAEWWKDVFVGSIKETFQEAFVQGQEGRTTREKSLNFIKAWGKIARYAAMGATVSFRPEAFVGDMDKVLDTLSGKTSFGDGVENFQGNIERTIDGYKNMARIANKINPFSAGDAYVGDKLAGGKMAGVEYQEGKRFPMGERPVEVTALAPVPEKLEGLQESFIIQKGEGVSHALLRQLSDDPEKFGFTGDSKDDGAVTEWARSEVKNIVTGGGYWNQKTSDGVGVSGKGGDAAYEMEKGLDDHLKINTYLKNDAGNFVKTETREVLKDFESAQLKTNMGPREYMRYGEQKEPIATPVTVVETPTKEALIVPEPSGEATAEYQPPVYDTPKSVLGSDTLERGEVYAEGVEEPTQKYTYNMPKSDMSSIFGATDGMDSPHWKDPQVGFENETVENVRFFPFPKPSGEHFGIEDAVATKKMQDYLDAVSSETGIDPNPGEKTGDYLARALGNKEVRSNIIKDMAPASDEPISGAIEQQNIPNINPDNVLLVAEKQVHHEINAILGSKGFLGFGVKDGMTSPDWTDRQVGFANATVENVMFPETHTYGGDKDFGIKNLGAVKGMQKLLTERFKETGIREKHGEEIGKYLTRTLAEKMGKGNALLTEVPIEPANIQEPEKGLPEERQKTDAEIKRDLKTWAREFDKDKDRFSRTETPPVEQPPVEGGSPEEIRKANKEWAREFDKDKDRFSRTETSTEVLPPDKDSVQEPLATNAEYIKEEPRVTINKIEIEEGKVSVTGTVEGSTGQEFLSKDYVPKLRRELTRENHDFNRALEQKANNASRNISLHLSAYQKLQREGKTDDAKKILEAIHRAINRADETLGKGAIDRSKIPAIETVEIPEKTIEKLEAMPEVKLEENPDTEARIAPVERTPEVTVENITTKTEVGNGNITETTGATAEVRGSTGQEFLSKDYASKLKSGGDAGSRIMMERTAVIESRNISAQLAAYNKLLSEGKEEDAMRHLSALHWSIDMAEKSLGAGVIDRSKIPGLK